MNPDCRPPCCDVLDEPHQDYVYTDAWITRLTTDLSDPAKFEEVIGHAPLALPDIQSDLVPGAGDTANPAADVG